MGMNFYLDSKSCEMCGLSRSSKHIGKSSCGWSFSFQGYPEDNIMSYEDWIKEMQNPNKIIRDEDGSPITLEDFKEKVEHKKGGLNHARIFGENQPLTSLEQAYVDEHHTRHDMAIYRHHKCWVDRSGNSFSGEDFS